MEKEFILDGKKVRDCHINIAKMNVFEYVYYSFKDWDIMKRFCYVFMDAAKEFFNAALVFFGNILSLVFFPIVFLIFAQREINVSKKICAKYQPRE